MSRRKNNRGVQRFNVEPVDNVGPEYFMGGKDGNNIDENYLSDSGNDIDWSTVVSKASGRRWRGNSDVSITVIKAHGNRTAFAFTFRKDEFQKMYDRKYLLPALSYNKKRMYFVENETAGYKLCREPHQANSYMRIKDNDYYTPFVGEHDIKWEPSRRCYYIELNE